MRRGLLQVVDSVETDRRCTVSAGILKETGDREQGIGSEGARERDERSIGAIHDLIVHLSAPYVDCAPKRGNSLQAWRCFFVLESRLRGRREGGSFARIRGLDGGCRNAAVRLRVGLPSVACFAGSSMPGPEGPDISSELYRGMNAPAPSVVPNETRVCFLGPPAYCQRDFGESIWRGSMSRYQPLRKPTR
jgi:hypothetical protein